MSTANQAFEVTAGLIPPGPAPLEMMNYLLKAGIDAETAMAMSEPSGVAGPMAEYTKQFVITSDEWHAGNDGDAYKESVLDHYEREANAYAAELRRSGLNWVRVDWIKF